jgi:hypothetical protein
MNPRPPKVRVGNIEGQGFRDAVNPAFGNGGVFEKHRCGVFLEGGSDATFIPCSAQKQR